MEFKLFTDLIDALGKVASGLKALVNLPKAERVAMHRTLDETYRLIDTTLNMVIIRLCRSLRVALRETQTLAGKLAGAVSAKDWDALLQQMQSIFATEGEVAQFIGQQFQQHASDARHSGQNAKLTQSIRDGLAAFRASLIAERQELIKQELELYTIV